MKKLFLLSYLFISFILIDYDLFSQGCAMCKGIVKSELNSGESGISSTINSGIIYLFSSTYFLIIVGAIFWYLRSKKNMMDEYKKKKIIKRISSLS
jgi:hypothetical protein|tara:strand:+ start:329 stop:616 length:288 start_codon:yes stop_codon:yes gene_type:complete